MKFRRRRDGTVSINLTPLIDIVFLLLIFFMVSTSFDRERRLTVELPHTEGTAQQALEQTAIEIVINAQGEYAVNDTILADTEAATLKAALATRLQGDRQVPLRIAADAETPHQSVVTVLDVAAQLGLTRLRITTNNNAH